MDTPRTFGGRQEGAGRKAKAPADRLYQINIYVDFATSEGLKQLPRARAVSLKRLAAAVLQDQVQRALSPERKTDR